MWVDATNSSSLLELSSLRLKLSHLRLSIRRASLYASWILDEFHIVAYVQSSTFDKTRFIMYLAVMQLGYNPSPIRAFEPGSRWMKFFLKGFGTIKKDQGISRSFRNNQEGSRSLYKDLEPSRVFKSTREVRKSLESFV